MPAACADTPVLTANTFTKGWATFGVALPQGAAKSALQVGSLPTQTDVKVRWPDGSIRFAVVSANVPRAGALPIVAGANLPGTFSPAPPQASVTLTIGGRAHVATLMPAQMHGDRWLNGPLVTEGRAVIAPGAHPFLRVIFDVRSYAGGGHRVDITTENCLDVASSDQVTYDVAIAINGKPVFQQANVVHKYLSRWRQVFTTGLEESTVTPNLTSFALAGALPAYLTTVAQPRRALIGPGVSGSGFGILGFGDLTVPMNAHSGRPELAPYPDWTAQYLVGGRADQRGYVLRHGELAGSWGVHIKEADAESLVSIDKHPYYWLDARWVDNRPTFDGPKNLMKGAAEPGDIAHQPSLAFVPYLLTGDRFFADEVAYWANFCLIGSFASDDNRKGAQGLLIGNEVRGIGWGLRTLGDAAAYLPDASPMKAYFASKVWNNLAFLDNYATSYQSGPVQTLFPGRRPEDGMTQYQPYMWISLWEQSYLAWAVDRVMQHGPITASVNFANAGAAIRNRIVRLQLALFTDPQWPKQRDREAPYLLAAGRWSADRKLTYFQNLGEVAAATFSMPKPAAPDFVRPFQGYYGPEARLMLTICQSLGDRGAAESLATLMSDATSGVTTLDDLNKRSGWAIGRVDATLLTKALTTPKPPAARAAASRRASH
ncbi:MAG TPA: hypothetical protein VKD69_16885 [Vicinamibacterales bacterium]|nr:hypothetical protein [Vicinamibacterales bacterium]